MFLYTKLKDGTLAKYEIESDDHVDALSIALDTVETDRPILAVIDGGLVQRENTGLASRE